MWEDTNNPLPGSSIPEDHDHSPEVQELPDPNDQQHLLIAQLREIIQKSDHSHSMTQEKVAEYANTLSKMKSRAKRNRADSRDEKDGIRVQTVASEKIMLLRQQMEENKLRLAERDRSQKGIEEMVTQIKAQLDDSQMQIKLLQTPLNISLIEDRVDYTPQLSSLELYGILLNKDKRISELNGRMAKLQANVLDLQENVKEKDSVIDARTKAITLMSENLSKKSKSTVDALEDTKLQMRQMQKRFIEVEEDLKQRNHVLQLDLDAKIAENSRLIMANAELVASESKLQEQLDKQPAKDNERESEIEFVKTINILEGQYEKLKQEHLQLKQEMEESNKSMIKAKAQHKIKVKELNKKIDGFRKVSDVHAELARSENDVSRLQLKIAELEEEKGQIQLSLVESHVSDVSIEDMKQQLETNRITLETRNEEIAKYLHEIDSLREKLDKVTHDEVKSELRSVAYEEQLEILETCKQSLQTQIDDLHHKMLDAESELEAQKKEKLEQLHKYEALLQENAELSDRIEKLSVEKVSSAESIEFVDNLTHQEKMELESYQKHLTLKETIEHSETPDLNESVNQLTEETSELVQKIELFTVERREVMEKLDLLTEENHTLNMKLKEIENNREVLAETYELLQTEKEVLDNKIAHYECEINGLKEKLSSQDTTLQVQDDLEEYRKLVSIQKEEIAEFKLKLLSSEVQEQWKEKYARLWDENEDLRGQVNNFDEIIEENKQEVNYLLKRVQSQENVAEEAAQEVMSKCAMIKTLEKSLKEANEEKEQKQREHQTLKTKINELEGKCKEQVEKMKKIAANLKKKSAECAALAQKLKDVENSTSNEIKLVSEQVEQLRCNYEQEKEKCANLQRCNEDIASQMYTYSARNEDLQNIIAENDGQLSSLRNQIEVLKAQGSEEQNVRIAQLQEELESLQLKILDQAEDIANIKEIRQNLERKIIDLGNELQLKERRLAEALENEGLLESRLEKIAKEDERNRTKIEEMQEENAQLQHENEQFTQDVDNYRKQLTVYNEKLKEFEKQQEMLNCMETEKRDLEVKTKNFENEIRRLNMDKQMMQEDSDRSENELQEQLESYAKERKHLHEQLEIARDQLEQFADNDLQLQNTVGVLNAKLDQQQIEFDETIRKFLELQQVHNKLLSQVENQQFSEPDMLQKLLNNKKQELEQFKRNHIPSPADFFGGNQRENQLESEIESIEQKMQSFNLHAECEEKFHQLQMDFEQLAMKEAQLRTEHSTALEKVGNYEVQINDLASELEETKQMLKQAVEERKTYIEPVSSAPSDNQNEDLLGKVKTLEFMLYNIEQEKESVLVQCAQLSDELGRFIYEKEKAMNQPIEDEIVTEEETRRPFEIPCETVKTLPHEEEICVQKTVYICQPSAFGDDDGWGIDPEETKLEEAHIQASESHNQLVHLAEQLRLLQLEKDAQQLELQQAQVKSGKLIKKLKEFKVRNEQLAMKLKDSESNDCGLDVAMLEELKSQVIALEKRIKEQHAELERERKERESCVKRCEVLGNANERLVEMKEKQDCEVISCQQRIRELQLKLEHVAWDTDSSELISVPATEAIEAKTQELIKELTLDNEELQALLEEQTKLRKEAENLAKRPNLPDNVLSNEQELLQTRIVSLESERNAIVQELNAIEKKMEEKLQEIDKEKTKMEATILENGLEMEKLTSCVSDLTSKCQQLELENNQLNSEHEQHIDALQKSYETKLSAMSEQLVAEWSAQVEQRGNDVAESWKLHVDGREKEFMHLEQSLRSELHELKEKCNGFVNENNELRRNVDGEIRNEARLQITEKELEQLNEKNETLSKQLHEQNEKVAQLQDAAEKELIAKDNEIAELERVTNELNQRIRELHEENQRELLRLKAEESQHAELKSQLHDAVLKITTLQGAIQEKEHRLSEYQEYIQQIQNDGASSASSLQTTIQELQQQISTYIMQLQENQVHIATLTEEVANCQMLGSHVQSKEMEIQRLNCQMEEKQREHEYALENQMLESQSVLSSQSQDLDCVRRRLHQVELARDEAIASSEAELEVCKGQLEQVQQELDESRMNCSEVSAKVEEYEGYVSRMSEYEQRIEELNLMIENQAIDIENLRLEVLDKSKNYDALVAELHAPHELKTGASQEEDSADSSKVENPVDAVSRAELDIALYMLHQRDVRCEELTVELMQLLEERDTLQLRLSNALREKEQIRSQFVEESVLGLSGAKDTLISSPVSGSQTTASILQATGNEMPSEVIEKGQESDTLENKLSELKVVGYKKDKTLVDEKELRRLQQLTFIEQHKDEVAKLPPEAQARLLDASYTLSRDVQSPSKVLLNWLWGKSTPKVNDI